MPERDWAKDWELCERARQVPIVCNSSPPRIHPLFVPAYNEYHRRQLMQEVCEALPYWLERVRELKAENESLRRKIRAVAGAVKAHVRWCIETGLGRAVGCQSCWKREVCEAVAGLEGEIP